ncbi:aminoglycoside phosphotransferase family protein [Nocardia sp. NPDC050710]|uniref:aminoglycoside phosphotransferase family protein n=1 Tax=Nocardia sp. NPDC050710 TaxID=3157220 RepID=UPI0033DE5DFE
MTIFEPAAIDARLAQGLVARQFPRLAHLPVVPVSRQGVDNRTFRLGDRLSVRLPAGDRYALAVEKEHRWLPRLAPGLPLPIPQPVAQGMPAREYPYPWSIYRWLDGSPVTDTAVCDRIAFATALGEFLAALRRQDPADAPLPGPHSWFRGAPVSTYAAETHRALDALGVEINRADVERVWDDAQRSTWTGAPVWFHGDIATGNLLVEHGRLSAVIDFGTCGVGDPACDTTIAWTYLADDSRAAFRAALGVDAATWSRGRGWVVWKTLITLVGELERDDRSGARRSRAVLDRVVAEHRGDR